MTPLASPRITFNNYKMICGIMGEIVIKKYGIRSLVDSICQRESVERKEPPLKWRLMASEIVWCLMIAQRQEDLRSTSSKECDGWSAMGEISCQKDTRKILVEKVKINIPGNLAPLFNQKSHKYYRESLKISRTHLIPPLLLLLSPFNVESQDLACACSGALPHIASDR
jgi:hypothetical protein